MATAEDYAGWIVANQDKRGSPEFQTVAQAYQMAKSQPRGAISAEDRAMADPTGSFGQNLAAGAGKAVMDTGHGIKQLAADSAELISPTRSSMSSLITGKPADTWANRLRKETDETRQLDAPLMDTGGGMTGNVLGNLAIALAPGGALKAAGSGAKLAGATGLADALRTAGTAAMVPKTILGAGAQGAALGAVQPVGTEDSRLSNAAIGGIAGAAIPAVATAAKGVKSLVEPLYQSGRDKILGRALQEASGGDTGLAARLAAARELVPGSLPTAGEAGENASIAALQRSAFASTPEVKNAVVARNSQQNTARVGELMDLAGSGGGRRSAEAARSSAAQKLYDEAYAGGVDLSRLEAGRSPFAAALSSGGVPAGKEPNGILSAIQKLGGIKNAEGTMRDITGEVRAGAGIKGIPPGLFNKSGLGLDDLATQLRDKGYLIPEDAHDGGVQFLKGMIRDEVGGVQKHLSGFEQDAAFARMANRGAPPDIPKNLTRAGDKINALWSRPAMQDAVKDAVTLAKNEGVNLETEAGTVKGLDYVGRALKDKIAKATPGSNEARVLTALRKDFLDNLDSVSPKYAQARTTFTEMSKPINAMDTAAEIAKRSVSGINDKLTPAAFTRALRDETAQSATGFNKATLANTLEPQQLARLDAIKADLKRADFAANAGRSGSDTVEKLAYNNMLSRFGVPTLLRSFAPTQLLGNLAAHGGNMVYGTANKQLQRQLAEALMSPQETAALIRAAEPSKRAALAAALTRGALTPAAMSLPATLNANQ